MTDFEFALFWGIFTLALVALTAVCTYEIGFWNGRKDMLDEAQNLIKQGHEAKPMTEAYNGE